MSFSEYRPYRPTRSGHGDVVSAFILILGIAFCLQAYSSLTEFAQLRAEGVTVTGKWVSHYTNPRDGEVYGIYLFEVDGKSYNRQQPLADLADQNIASGDPVAVIYLPTDPDESRIAGTEGYHFSDVLGLLAGLVVCVLAAQYIFAYYTRRSAWIFWLQQQVARVTDRWPAFR